MGVDIRVYTVYGVKTDWDKEFFNKWNSLVDPEEDDAPIFDQDELPFQLMDLYSSKFFIFGFK